MPRPALWNTLAEADTSALGPCFVGFDGFTDEIISVVDKRESPDSFAAMKTISDMGQRIADAAGKSANIELVPGHVKIGGNGPILANALSLMGYPIYFAGTIGQPGSIEPLFSEMVARFERVWPLGPSGHTDALEFHDGKILLGKHGPLRDLDYASLTNSLSETELTEALENAPLSAFVNWTMLPHMTKIWREISQKIGPKLTGRHRRLFIDFCDPAKRSLTDLKEALHTLEELSSTFHIILGLNESEATQVGRAVGISRQFQSRQEMCELAKEIHKKLCIQELVIHSVAYALASYRNEVVVVDGPYTPNPKISTGAGDNFNAGYCHGELLGLTLEEKLLTAVATSGYYVRMAKSPSQKDLVHFLKDWLCTI